uniref:E2F transcription factor CC-MB domain-containing protein n=1 Tax=Kryptolebias marmoratus TaxID=37003 RepID=A0A3Q3EH79_KRYMA
MNVSNSAILNYFCTYSVFFSSGFISQQLAVVLTLDVFGYEPSCALKSVHRGKKANEDELEELVALAEEEEELDYLIQSCTQQIRKLCEQRHIHRYPFVYVCGIQSLKGQTVIVIKAPAETKVQVPHPEESLQVHIRSTNGPIEVFLCSDPMESTGNTAASSTLEWPQVEEKEISADRLMS